MKFEMKFHQDSQNICVLNIRKMAMFLWIVFTSMSMVDGKNKPKCSVCTEIVLNFQKGLVSTAKSNFGGGNTKWEEKSLGSYSTSEVRLVEILEHICDDSSKECHPVLEEYEELVEKYWFQELAQKKDTNFYNFFCIDHVQACCPNNTYGPDCSQCPGGIDQPCSGNGKCLGEGTREGSGKCQCTSGYQGDLCNQCKDGFYEESKNDTHTVCKVRDVPGENPSSKPSQDKVAASRQDVYQEQLAQVPELANLGALFKSSSPVEVTESETEYYIQCVKHTFSNYIVFQFDCTNTLNDQILEKVTVEMEPADGFEVTKYIPCPSLAYNKPGTTYTLVRLPSEPTQVTGTFACTLKFLVKDCDPQTGEPDEDGYDDEYVLEDVEVSVADHVQKVMKPNFAASWEEVGPENELEDTYALSTMNTLEEAIKNIIQYIGLQPCERSDKVPEGKSSHTLYLAGVFRGGHDALVRAKLALDSSGVTMQLTVRSTDPHVSEVLATAVA